MGRGVGRNQILSGPAGMAAGDGTRGLYLSNQPRLAQRRTLRPDVANPPRRVIDTCEYCGGVRTGKSGFLPAVPENRARLPQRARNAPPDRRTSRDRKEIG